VSWSAPFIARARSVPHPGGKVTYSCLHDIIGVTSFMSALHLERSSGVVAARGENLRIRSARVCNLDYKVGTWHFASLVLRENGDGTTGEAFALCGIPSNKLINAFRASIARSKPRLGSLNYVRANAINTDLTLPRLPCKRASHGHHVINEDDLRRSSPPLRRMCKYQEFGNTPDLTEWPYAAGTANRLWFLSINGAVF
jgi:hypothetical protein